MPVSERRITRIAQRGCRSVCIRDIPIRCLRSSERTVRRRGRPIDTLHTVVTRSSIRKKESWHVQLSHSAISLRISHHSAARRWRYRPPSGRPANACDRHAANAQSRGKPSGAERSGSGPCLRPCCAGRCVQAPGTDGASTVGCAGHAKPAGARATENAGTHRVIADKNAACDCRSAAQAGKTSRSRERSGQPEIDFFAAQEIDCRKNERPVERHGLDRIGGHAAA